MPIYYYLDASAVVKRYLTSEAGAEFIGILLEDAMPNEVFYISTFGVLEVNAAIRRRIRNERALDEALRKFGQDSVGILRVIPTNEVLLQQALPVVHTHSLRAGDAIHLATALSVAADANNEQVYMVTSDHELLAAASAAGIGAIDPQSDEAIDGLLHIRAQ